MHRTGSAVVSVIATLIAGFLFVQCDSSGGECRDGQVRNDVGLCADEDDDAGFDVDFSLVDRPEREDTASSYSQVFVPDMGNMTLVTLDPVVVEPDDLSLTLWIPYPDAEYVLLNKIINPFAEELYDLSTDIQNDFINDDFDLHYVPEVGFLSLMIPNTSRISLVQGTYQIEILVDDESKFNPDDVIITRQKRRGQSFNANFWFVQVRDLFDTAAPLEDEKFSQSIEVFKQVYDHAGFEVAEIATHRLEDNESQPYAEINTVEELEGLCTRTGYPQTLDGVNVFLVRRIVLEDLDDSGAVYTILGYASALPGPPDLLGSKASCIVVSAEALIDFPRTLGHTMAHEVGHWLGLFHTTEAVGFLYDAIDDTPQCITGMDSNQDGIVYVDECRSLDGTNLMFWAADDDDSFSVGDDGIHLTPGQSWVLERHPQVRFPEPSADGDEEEEAGDFD